MNHSLCKDQSKTYWEVNKYASEFPLIGMILLYQIIYFSCCYTTFYFKLWLFIHSNSPFLCDIRYYFGVHPKYDEYSYWFIKILRIISSKNRLNDILSNILRMQGGVFLQSNYIILSEFWDTFLFIVKNVPIMPI